MLDFIKKNYFNLCLILVYIVIACLVYGIWTYSAWHLWYVTLIVVLAICGLGAFIGFLWLKSLNKKEEEKPQEEIVQ